MKLFDVFLAFIMCFVWASDFIVMKEALNTISPFLLTTLRFGVIALCIMPFIRRLPPHFFKLSLVSFSLVVLHYGFQDSGIHLNSSVTVSNLITECATLVMIIFAAIFLKEKINRKILLGIVTAFLGMILVILGNVLGVTSLDCDLLHTTNFLSILLLIVSIFGWATYIISVKKFEDKMSALEIIGWTALIGCIQAGIVSVIFEDNQIQTLRSLDVRNVALVLFTGIFGTFIPNKIIHHLIKFYSVTNVSLIALFVPLLVAIESYFFFDEKLTATVIGGGILIISGIYITTRSKSVDNDDINDKSDDDYEPIIHSGCGICYISDKPRRKNCDANQEENEGGVFGEIKDLTDSDKVSCVIKDSIESVDETRNPNDVKNPAEVIKNYNISYSPNKVQINKTEMTKNNDLPSDVSMRINIDMNIYRDENVLINTSRECKSNEDDKEFATNSKKDE